MDERDEDGADARARNLLAERIRDRIDAAYGGNFSAFARAVGIPQQYVNKLVHGLVKVPQRRYREKLGPELGLNQLAFYVIAGELTDEEARGGWGGQRVEDLPVPPDVIEAALLMAGLPPRSRAAVLALVRQLRGEVD